MLDWLKTKLAPQVDEGINPPWRAGQYVTYYGERPDGLWLAIDLRLAGQLEDSSWAIQGSFKGPSGEGAAWLRTDPMAKEGDLDIIPGKMDVVRVSPGSGANDVMTECMGQMALALNIFLVSRWKGAHDFVKTTQSRPAQFPCGVNSVHEYVTDGPGYKKHHAINRKVMLTGIACYSVDGMNNPVIATSFGTNGEQGSSTPGDADHIDLANPKRIQHDGFALSYPATWFLRPDLDEKGQPLEPSGLRAVVGGNAGAVVCSVTIHRGSADELAARRAEITSRMADRDWKARSGVELNLKGDAQGYVEDRTPAHVNGLTYAALFLSPQKDRLAHVNIVAIISQTNTQRFAMLAAMEPVFRGILESFEFN